MSSPVTSLISLDHACFLMEELRRTFSARDPVGGDLLMEALQDFHDEKITPYELLHRASNLLLPWPDLIPLFNELTPQGFVLVKPLSEGTSSTLALRRFFSRSLTQDKRKAEAQQRSLEYLDEVNRRFNLPSGQRGPESQAFLSALQEFQKTDGGALALRKQVYNIFHEHHDLCVWFDEFLSPTLLASDEVAPFSPKDEESANHVIDLASPTETPKTTFLSLEDSEVAMADDEDSVPDVPRTPSPNPSIRSSSDKTVSVESSPATDPASLSDVDSVINSPPMRVRNVTTSEVLAPLPFYPAFSTLVPADWPDFSSYEQAVPLYGSSTPTQNLMDDYLGRRRSTITQAHIAVAASPRILPPRQEVCNPIDLSHYQFPKFLESAPPTRPSSPGWVYDVQMTNCPVIYPFGVARGRHVRFEDEALGPLSAPVEPLQPRAEPITTYAKVVKNGSVRRGKNSKVAKKQDSKRSVRGVERGKQDEVVPPASRPYAYGAIGDGRPRKDIKWKETASRDEDILWRLT